MSDTMQTSPPAAWIRQGQPFFEYLDEWITQLQPASLKATLQPVEKTAIVSVDVINGFCHEGPLASPRVAAIIPPIVRLFERAWAAGVRHIVLAQDTHEPEAVEFAQYPPHCVRGSHESEAVPEFRALPFYPQMETFEKNSIHAGLNTGLNAWIDSHPAVTRYIVVGDCTDLCTYHLAMHLRLDANARQIDRRVLLPANCTDTYDLPVAAASAIGAVPHDAGVLHRIFLYSMHLNGVEVVASIG
ncbi:MAG TPA: isochorismatase family cysteine hydrolase [Anaerolineales bacterium]|nr:isochorismatase family cysteine hydrolase [Anaerolineales bacterium]